MFFSTVPSLKDVNTRYDECEDSTGDSHRWLEPGITNHEDMQYPRRVYIRGTNKSACQMCPLSV